MGSIENEGGEADRLAGNVMEEIDAAAQAHRESERLREARRKAAGPRKKIGLGVLFVIFLVLTTLNISGIGPFGVAPASLSGVDLREAMSCEVDDMMDQLTAYREEFGTYPQSLVEIGVDDDSWGYELLSPDHCRVALQEAREVVSADLMGK